MERLQRLWAVLRTERARAYTYRVLTAVGALAILYGVVTEDELAAWGGLVTQVLNVGGNALASANTTTQKGEPDHG